MSIKSRKRKGFSLLEIVVVLGLFMTTIAATISITGLSYKNLVLNENHWKATLIAQNIVDEYRNIRDTNIMLKNVSPTLNIAWDQDADSGHASTGQIYQPTLAFSWFGGDKVTSNPSETCRTAPAPNNCWLNSEYKAASGIHGPLKVYYNVDMYPLQVGGTTPPAGTFYTVDLWSVYYPINVANPVLNKSRIMDVKVSWPQGDATKTVEYQTFIKDLKAQGAALNAATHVDHTSGLTAWFVDDSGPGTIVSKTWSYGDGASDGTGVHTYASGGTYQAHITVTDNLGRTATSSDIPVTVAAIPAGVPLHCDAAAGWGFGPGTIWGGSGGCTSSDTSISTSSASGWIDINAQVTDFANLIPPGFHIVSASYHIVGNYSIWANSNSALDPSSATNSFPIFATQGVGSPLRLTPNIGSVGSGYLHFYISATIDYISATACDNATGQICGSGGGAPQDLGISGTLNATAHAESQP